MKCLVTAMVPPDAAMPPTPRDPWAPPDAGPTAYRDPWAPDAGAAANAVDLPACTGYLAAMEAYAACPQFPESARDGVRETIETMKSSFADYATMPEATRQMIDEACTSATENVRQSAVSIGCTIP
jgi:hypothetical protein